MKQKPDASRSPALQFRWATRAAAPWRKFAVPIAAVLAPALGGTTQLWAQATITLMVGLLLVVAPPRRSLGAPFHIGVAVILVLACGAFLPAAWFPSPEWRIVLGRLSVALPVTRTAQPWLTAESLCLFLVGIGWVYFVFGCEWTRERRQAAVEIFGGGILLLGCGVVTAHLLATHIPFWPDAPEFGFFPNRNQTSNVLALGGVMIYASSIQRWRDGHRLWWLWLGSLSLILSALILSYSRAGIALLLLGIAAWQSWHLARVRNVRTAVIGIAALLLLAGILVLVGGETLARLGSTVAGPTLTEDARINIYRDCVTLLKDYPAFGLGLGNFPAVFPFYRQFSVAANELIHPESDWLWVMAELGWASPFVLLALLIIWLRRVLPFAPGTGGFLRCGAMICACAFALHGLVDVSGHRLGAFWPAAFLAGIALNPNKHLRALPTLSVIGRLGGFGLIVIAAWWFASIAGADFPPTSVTRDRLEAAAEAALASGENVAAARAANAGLAVAPLDWNFYFKRAVTELESTELTMRDRAVRDFAIVRYLTPHWPDVCLQEGAVWIAADEADFAFDAWDEALRRATTAEAPDIYAQMYQHIQGNTALIDRWRELGRSCGHCVLGFLQRASSLEFDIELRRLAAEDPAIGSFNPGEIRALLASWYLKGDRDWLAETLETRSDWLPLGWQWLAQIKAEKEDYQGASELVRRFTKTPTIPLREPRTDLEAMKARLRFDSNDVAAGLDLYEAQLRAGQDDDALATLRALETVKSAPAWIPYLEAQLWARKGDWKKEWQALAKFGLSG